MAQAPDPQYYETYCPHCAGAIQIPKDGLNCRIFRHGVYRADPDMQIGPHAPETECERLVAEGLIYGCGRPFTFDGAIVAPCGYI